VLLLSSYHYHYYIDIGVSDLLVVVAVSVTRWHHCCCYATTSLLRRHQSCTCSPAVSRWSWRRWHRLGQVAVTSVFLLALCIHPVICLSPKCPAAHLFAYAFNHGH